MIKYISICILFIQCLLVAQEHEIKLDANRPARYKDMPINFSFMPGMSVGEIVHPYGRIVNHVSFNIAGSAYKLEGIEYGIVWNHYREEVTGIQVCAIGNRAEGYVRGVQNAGIVNISHIGMNGIQMAGITNINQAELLGIQAAGIYNSSTGFSQGIQLAGIANNVESGLSGMQVAGISNSISDDFYGIQVAGISSSSGNGSGFQVSGIVNSSENFTGLQISGLVNVSDKMSGVQIAPINIAGSNDGASLGIFSFVGETGVDLALWTDENKLARIGIVSGNERFVNIAYIGFDQEDEDRWLLGFTWAVNTPIGEDFYIEAGQSAEHINEPSKGFWTNELHFITRTHIVAGYELSEGIKIFAGPTFNFYYSILHDGSSITDKGNPVYRNNHHFTRDWFGMMMGIRLM